MSRSGVISSTLVIALVVPTTCGLVGCEQGGKIAPVKDWIVSFATATGAYVVEKATTFAGALSRAWTAFWGTDKVNNVIVDKGDPLKGIYDGLLRSKVEWGSGGSRERANLVEIKLDHPRMVRESESTTEWKLAPKEEERIKELQRQLLEVS